MPRLNVTPSLTTRWQNSPGLPWATLSALRVKHIINHDRTKPNFRCFYVVMWDKHCLFCYGKGAFQKLWNYFKLSACFACRLGSLLLFNSTKLLINQHKTSPNIKIHVEKVLTFPVRLWRENKVVCPNIVLNKMWWNVKKLFGQIASFNKEKWSCYFNIPEWLEWHFN